MITKTLLEFYLTKGDARDKEVMQLESRLAYSIIKNWKQGLYPLAMLPIANE